MSTHVHTHARTHARTHTAPRGKTSSFHLSQGSSQSQWGGGGEVSPLSFLATPLGTVFLPLLHMPRDHRFEHQPTRNLQAGFDGVALPFTYMPAVPISAGQSRFVVLSTSREIQGNSVIHKWCLNMQIGKYSLFTFHLRVHSSLRYVSQRSLCLAIEV